MQENDDIEKKQKEAQRKREYRAKVKAIADDSYVPTAIEEAKMYLESMEDPIAIAAFEHPELGKKLTQDDRRTLTNYVYHLKSKRKSQ